MRARTSGEIRGFWFLSAFGYCQKMHHLLYSIHGEDMDKEIEIMLDMEQKNVVTLGELTPKWWI